MEEEEAKSNNFIENGEHAGSDTLQQQHQQQSRSLKQKTTRASATAENYIVGGQTAQQGAYPWFVHGKGCGGSLIWPDIVLSAAHCADAFRKYAVVGAYYADEKRDLGSGQAEEKSTRRQIVHPLYNYNKENGM